MKRAITEEYGKLILKPDQVIALANICYEPWRRDLEIAKRKWRNERLPEIEKRIETHNKSVKANKSTYSFNTYLPIGEQDKKAIIEKEEDFYIFTSQKVYQFLSNFTVKFNKKTIEETSPGFLNKLDLETANGISFSVKSSNGNKLIEMDIRTNGLWDEKLKYRIEGTDDGWIVKTKENVENILDHVQRPHEFTKYKSLVAIISAFVLTITFFQVLTKLSLLNFIVKLIPFVGLLTLNILASGIFFVFLTIKLLNKINPQFPFFAIKEHYDPFDSNFVKVTIFFAGAVLSPLIWALLQVLFIK